MPVKRIKNRDEPRAAEMPGGDLFRQRPLAPDPTAAIPAAFVRAPTWHPFLYRKRIERVEKGRPGDLVAVYGPNDRVLGYGLYNPRSEIAVRMFFYGEELPDDAAWQKKLDEAVALRHDLLRLNDVTDAYRVIHAEADGLPGWWSTAWATYSRPKLTPWACTSGPRRFLPGWRRCWARSIRVVRPSPQFLSQEGCEPPGFASPELPEEVTIREYGTRFRVRFVGGHKTGFFCDQRENRKRLAEFCEGRTCSISAAIRAGLPCRPSVWARRPK